MSTLIRNKTALAALVLLMLASFTGKLAAQDPAIRFRVSGASVTEKDTFTVALIADSVLTGRNVLAYRFWLSYSPSYLEFIELDGEGPVLTAWGSPVLNQSNPGTIVLAGAGTEELSGSGDMVYLKFRALRSGSSTISFNTSESYLNERNPSSVFTNGTVSSAARSYPNIYPDSRNMIIGDEVQMSVSGGIGPYVYSSANTSVVQITDVDKARAVGPGTTRITVTDDNAETSTTTGLFDVRAIRMDLEEVSVWPADTFYIPVKLEVAPGTSVYSGRFDLAYWAGLTALPDAVAPGDFSLSIQHNAKNGRVSVSFAGTVPVTGNGVLCYLPFRANSSGNQAIWFENMRFNETLLAWTLKSTFYIDVKSLPTLSLSPNSGSLMWGDIQKINVFNGTGPYTWSVSNPSIASIDQQGNLTTISGGQLTVTATDANGATKTSGVFTIADHQVSIFSSEGVLDIETRVPIIGSSLPPGKAVFGFRAGVSFNTSHLGFVRAEAVSGGLVSASESGGTIDVAGAMSQGVSSGIIGFLVFNVQNDLALNASTLITINSFSANENSFYTTLQNGTVTRVEQTSYRPVAIAGLNFSLEEGAAGQLDGTASFDLDGDPLTYRWTAPAELILDDSTSATPGFTAPYVSENTEYDIRLIVNDGSDDSDPAFVKVTVLQVNQRPEADAGSDMNYVEGSSVDLDGSGSFDPDGDALSYDWESLDGIILFNTSSVSPSFILPQVSENTSYRFTLQVNDGALSSSKDTVSITAIQVNQKPVAFAGGDFSLDEGTAGELDGSLSYDADNDPLSYQWTAPSQVTLSSTTVAKPTFTAPAVLRDSVLSFSLVVNDGNRDSDPDVVLVRIVNLDSLSMENMIDSVFMISLDSSAIDTANSSILLYVPYGLDIRSLAPGFRLSEGAFMNPASGSVHDFSTPVYYTVTAEDGVTTRLWKVEVFRPERTMQRSLVSGWNWISLNLRPGTMDIVSLFGTLSLSDLDYVISAEYSSTWYSATGWFGNLVEFPQDRMVRFRKSTAELLSVDGQEINPTVTPIPIVKGWNDLAYLPGWDAAINDAIDESSLPAGEILLKGMNGSVIYYPGSGWTGELDTLRVLRGYRTHTENSGNLYYKVVGSKKSGKTSTANSDVRLHNRAELLQEYKLKPQDYEYSATLIAEAVTERGEPFLEAGDLLIARSGAQIRGISEAVYVPDLERYLFILSYYSNKEIPDIRFYLKRASEQHEYTTDLQLEFSADRITGEARQPYPMVVMGLDPGSVNPLRNRLSLYPNPVMEQLNITSDHPLQGIRIYNVTGEIMLDLKESERSVSIPLGRLVPGIYTLEAVTNNEVIIRKIIKTSY